MQDRSDYIKACNTLLLDGKFYKILDEDPSAKYQKDLKKLLQKSLKDSQLQNNLKISDLMQRFDPIPGRFYTLPKIHKNMSPPPGRPIISGNGMVTEIISGFVSTFLNDEVKKLPSYIQDTTHFLLELEKIKTHVLPTETFLVTLDVVSLYPNIPHKEGCEASSFFLNQRQHPEIPTSFLMSLIDFVLTHNNFTFENEHFLQLMGTAMGTKMGPGYACLFMGKFEQDFLRNVSFQPLLWKRFIDDIFMIWTHGEDKFNSFFEKINSIHPSIKFEAQKSTTCISFLDVSVKLNNGKIETDLFTKPTDSHNYLDWHSCHPKSTKKGIPFSQALRLRRICSNDKDFYHRLFQLEGYLRVKNYPAKIIRGAFTKVQKISREQILVYKEQESISRVTFPITYHPNIKNLVPGLHEKYNNILLQDQSNKVIYPDPPMVAFRRPPNLRDLITRASISYPNRSKPGLHDCEDQFCPLHRHNNPSQIIWSTHRNLEVKNVVSCKDHNIIYLISCKKRGCGAQYIGETGRTFKDRAKEHLNSVKNIKQDCPISNHFNDISGHKILNIEFQILEKCKYEDTAYRRNREHFYINLLRPNLNVQNTHRF